MLTIKPLNKEFNSGFQIIGHAEYAEHGADIVCSAVSAMSQMTEQSLKRYCAVLSDIKPGNMKVNILNPNTYSKVLVESMLNGMRTVAMKYPQYVTIQEEYHDKRF